MKEIIDEIFGKISEEIENAKKNITTDENKNNLKKKSVKRD